MKRLFRGSGILNLLGMTVAFASLYILLVQVYHDLTYNKGIKDAQRLYIMAVPSWFEEGNLQVSMNRPVASMIAGQSPMVESYGVARINIDNKRPVFIGEGENQKQYSAGISELTRGALDVFGFNPVAGTFEGIEKTNAVAISEKMAKAIGAGVGDAVRLISETGTPYTVAAVYEDMPLNSDLGNVEVLFCNQLETNGVDNWSEWGYNNFVKLTSAAELEAFEEGAVKIVEKVIREELFSKVPPGEEITDEDVQKYIKRATPKLIPFEELYFAQTLDNHSGRQGNRTTTLTLLAVAILIVVITLINFVNFFFAQVPMRIKSVNTRKILGSSRGALVVNLMAESGALVAVSLCAAVAVVLLFKSSTYANLISCSLAFPDNFPAILITVAAAIVMTVASSVYPALYITSFPPALAIKGSFGMSAKGKTLRYVLIALQFIISISFVICAICIKRQHSYMMNYDMGFNKEYLLTADLPIGSFQARETIQGELLKSTLIKDVAWAAGPLVNTTRMSWGRPFKDGQIGFDSYPVSWNFLRFMGIEVVEGRDFTESDEVSENGVFIFNQVAKNKFGLTLEDRILGHRDVTDIAGFCEDFQFRPLQYELTPFAFYIFGKEPWWQTTHLYIRCEAGAKVSDVSDALRETVHNYAPDHPVEKLNVNFFDHELGYMYQKEKNLTTLVTLFTVMAIIISLMGVFGLVIFETQYRRKEIGVRRVHGSTIGEILQMFNLKFAKLLLICFIVAAPLSWFIIDYYYSTFAYSAPISLWIFALAFCMVAVIVSVVVTAGSLKAAMENPVSSLKSE